LKKIFLAVVLTLIFVLSINIITVNAEYFLNADRLYITATNHFDTVWNWQEEYTVKYLLPNTLHENFSLFEKYPEHNFSFEGGYRYQLAEEYYPEEFERLKEYVDKGNWSVSGSAIENGDVNVPSPEALFRNFLYGNNYFEDKFGKRSKDIFLPDCFGFGYALPSIAEHSNLLGFTTMKLTDSNMAISSRPFDIGKWYGVNGKYTIANIKAAWPARKTDFRGVSGDITRLNQNKAAGYNAASVMVGEGDLGGGADSNSVRIATTQAASNSATNVNVVQASSDQVFRDMTQTQRDGMTASYNGEMLLRQHGTGAYSSQTITKRWNRMGEQIGDRAERSAVAANWLGTSDYPLAKFNEAWNTLIRHQFHDDITGTATSQVFTRSQNDYMISIKEFASEYTSSVDGVAALMKTSVSAGSVPLVVNNPLSYKRCDAVEATVDMLTETPYVRVFDTSGNEVASQITKKQGTQFDIVFIATVSSLGYRTYEVRPSTSPCAISGSLSVSANALSNDKYNVTIDANGDISSIYDKTISQELLNNPVRLAQFNNSNNTSYGAWELILSDYWNVTTPQKGYVGSTGAPSITVLEDGPARVSLQIDRKYRDSTYSQIVSLSAAGNVVRVDNVVDWYEYASFLKAVFDLRSSNARATYDLGLGAIERGNNANSSSAGYKAEVPHQKWADMTATDGAFGVSILNDCKYGIDKPNNSQLRLTLIHTPYPEKIHSKTLVPSGQRTQEFGENRFAFGIYGHSGSFSGSGTQEEAEAFNQPMKAFQTTSHDGRLGDDYSFASISNDRVIVRTVKKAERSNEVVVRVNEGSGVAAAGVELSMGDGIISAREIYASEESIGPATVVDGKLVFDIGGYDVKTFALTLQPTAQGQKKAQTPVDLPYNRDVFSSNENKSDGGMTLMKDCFPAELVPETIIAGATQYKMGSKADGALNAVAAGGQTVNLPSGFNTLKILASSTVGDIAVPFTFGSSSTTVEIGDYSENIANWDNFTLVREGYVKNQAPGFVATHRHTDGEDNVLATTYMFAYSLDIPAGATSVTLPNNEGVLIYAATAVNDNSRTIAASSLHDEKARANTGKFNPFNGFTDFEVGSPAPVENTTTGTVNNVTNQRCELSTEQAFSGSRSLKISGSDNNPTSAYVYFDIVTDSPFKIVPGTILTYKFYAGNDLGRYVAIDMPIYDGDINMYNGGSNLRDRTAAIDINQNVRIHPNVGHGVVGEWVTVTVDLYKCAPESTVERIMLDYNNPNGQSGNFVAYIDDLSIRLPQAPEGQDELVWNIGQARGVDATQYSKTSAAKLSKAIDFAQIVSGAANASANEKRYALKNLQDAMYVGLVTAKDANKGVSALDFNSFADVTFNGNTVAKRTDYIDNIDSGDWIKYRDIDFGAGDAGLIAFEYASGNTGNSNIAYVDVRLDHQNGPLLASIPLLNTGSSSTYRWVTSQIESVSGEHDICLTFVGNGSNAINRLRSFRVYPWAIDVNVTTEGRAIQNLKLAAGKPIDADVSIDNGSFDGSISCIAALYDQAGRLYSVVSKDMEVDAGASNTTRVSIIVPEDVVGMTYKLFVWDGETYIPLIDATTIEYAEMIYYDNLALRAQTRVSSFETANPAANAVDGNTSGTRWASSGAIWPSWIEIDLGEECELDDIRMYWYDPSGRYYQWKVYGRTSEISNWSASRAANYNFDADSEYTLLVNKSDNTTRGTQITDQLNKVKARYIVVQVTGSSNTGGYPSIYEIEIAGSKG